MLSQFDFKKYKTEDRELARGCDSSLLLHMSAIRYVHTKRFLAETLAFLDHFIVLDTSLQVIYFPGHFFTGDLLSWKLLYR